MDKLYKQWMCDKYLMFHNPPEYIDTWPATVRTVYCMYDNAIDISEKIVEEWYTITQITWYTELMQCKLDMEYEVEYTFMKTEYLRKIEENQMIERQNILEWRETSLVYNR